MTRAALFTGLVVASLMVAVANAQPAGRGPQCGVFEESHGSITVTSVGSQFSIPQLTSEGRFRGVGPVFGCWVEIGKADDVRSTFTYGYRVTEPGGASKEYGPSGIEIGGSGATGLIPVLIYKPPTGTWRVEFYTIRREGGARASLGSVSFTMTGGAVSPTPPPPGSGKQTLGSVLDTRKGPPSTAGKPGPTPGTVQTPAASGLLFEDRFARPDADTPGAEWTEYTLRGAVAQQQDSPWRISGNTLRYEATGRGMYWEDFVETTATFPVDNLRVEFELRGQASTSQGYVGPTVFLSGEGRFRATAQNVSSGLKQVGVAAWYRYDNQGTRGVIVAANGSLRDHADAVFAGVNEPAFTKHVLTIRNGTLTYEAPGFPVVSYPLGVAAGERRHLTFGVRLYDANVPQVVEIRNVKVTALGGSETLTTSGIRGIQTGPAVQVLSASVPAAGGTLSVQRPGDPLDRFTIEVPPNSYPSARQFSVSYEPIASHTLGRSVTPISPLITVDNGGAYGDNLIRVTIPVTVPTGHFAMAFYYDRSAGTLEGMPLLGIGANAVTVATRHFSSFLISMIPIAALDELIVRGTADSHFRPGLDDWQFPNRGSYIEPDGHCAGQSLTALWYFVNRPDGPGVHLWNHHDRNGGQPATPRIWEDDSRAYRLASVVQRDIDWQSWEFRLTSQLSGLGDEMTLRAFAYAITVTGEPQNVGIGSSTGGGHNMIAYLVKDGALYIADPNYPGDNNRRIVFNRSTGKFTPYNSGANAADIAAGRGKAYEAIKYQAKSATFDWAAIGRRWGELRAGSIGSGSFPGYQLYWMDEHGQKAPLVDGAVIEQTYVKFDFKVAGAAASAARLYLNGAPAEKSVNGMYELRPGRNEVGVEVLGKRTGTERDFDYVDFKYVNVTSGEAAPPPDDPKPEDNACTIFFVTDVADPAAQYRAFRARPPHQTTMDDVLMGNCDCPLNVSDAELLACLKGEPVAELKKNPCAGFTLADFKRGNSGNIAWIQCAIACSGPIGAPAWSDAKIQACLDGLKAGSSPKPPPPKKQ